MYIAAVSIAGTWQKSRQDVHFLRSIFIASVTVGSGMGEMHKNLMWYTNVSDQSHHTEPNSWIEEWWVSNSNLHHSGRQGRSEEKTDMWFLGHLLHAVESANAVSCIYSSKSCRMCMQ